MLDEMTDLWESDPRSYALALIENGDEFNDILLIACLKYMSHDDVRDMLDANELSLRFLEEHFSFNE
jgi:hypothetical protein